MSHSSHRPLLFLDVDGPLNPYAAKPQRRPEGYVTLRVPQETEPGIRLSRPTPLRVWLAPAHGPALLALDYDLCWATTWMNQDVNPRIGLLDADFAALAASVSAVPPVWTPPVRSRP